MLLIWVLLGIAAVGVVATYSRTPIGELPNATIGGIMGGARPAVAYISFTVALAANRDRSRGPRPRPPAPRDRVPRGRRDHRRVALWPGSLDETGLEITPARALATVGAILAFGLTLAAWRTNGIGHLGREQIVKRGPTTHEIPVYLTSRGPFPGS